jgi:hypothetical protein
MAYDPATDPTNDPNYQAVAQQATDRVNALANAGPESSSAPPYTSLINAQYNPRIYTGLEANQMNIENRMFSDAFFPNFVSQDEKQTYIPLQNSPDQELNPNAYNTPITTNTPVQQATAAQIAQQPVTSAAQYNANLTSGATGTVDPNSLLQNQMTTLLHSNLNENGIPEWAQPAVTAANQRMNSLGLGASTMAGNATAQAILSTALPMAAQNASVYATLNLTNLSNAQQAMLSNQAATNAAAQFNAQSQQQNAQFFATLATQIATQNAQMQTAVSQFNAGQVNAAEQFNENLQNQQNQFNIGNQLLIDQSNVQWRRTINTVNTAGINAVNQANAQNLLNIQQSAQNQLWQEAQDEASWALTSAENAKNRQLALVVSGLNRQTAFDLLSAQQSAQMFSQLGGLAGNLVGKLFDSSSSGNANVSQDFGGGPFSADAGPGGIAIG